MDICYLINRLAPGGAPTLLLDIVRQADREDITFTVAFIEGDDTLVSDFEDAGAKVVSFDAAIKFDPRALWRLFQFFRQNSFDIVHTHLPYAQTLGRLGYLVGEHGAVVSTQHNFQDQYHSVTRFTEYVTRPIDNVTIGVSKAVVDSFTDVNSQDEWRIIYNGVDIGGAKSIIESTDVDQIRDRLNIPRESQVVLSVGRYVEEKRHADTISAFAKADLEETHLVLVGWGSERENLQQLSEEHGVSDKVTLTGKEPNVWPYYALADTFVSASENESFGLVLVEAMVAELPIVATEIPGAKEVLEQAESGVLSVPPRDSEALAVALEQSLNNPPAINYTNAIEKFDIRKIASEHIKLYEELLSEKKT